MNILIAEQERSRIGQDLHDTLGHVFASLTLKSELAMKLIDQQPAKARDEIESINELSKDTLKKVRNIIENLQTPSFHEEVKAVSTILKDAQIDFAFSNTQIVASLNPAKQALVSMILKEAINNIIKHANATTVKINVSDYQKYIMLTIQDNGIGMNNKDKEKLSSIRNRVNYLNGELNIENHNGTKLTICVPRGEMM
ncbi:sensor histidine kinase [Staphylococcus warneri]|uniref:sensor histidine kinase n=1 Tax=Staphylococcus warneri TaxID=1292 RepID=UPI0027FE61C2|nr:histidine kinase [Staphylococcus warneri]MDQ7158270.1 histidine kinase [Staphylococcus warneri]